MTRSTSLVSRLADGDAPVRLDVEPHVHHSLHALLRETPVVADAHFGPRVEILVRIFPHEEQRIGVLRPPDLLDRNADRHPRSVGNRTSVGQRRGTPRSAQTVVHLLHRPAGCRRRRSELRMIAALLRIVHVAPLRDVSRLVDLQDDAHDRRDRVRRNLLLDGNLLDRGGHARHKDPDHRTVECGRRHLRLREDRSRSGKQNE